MNKIGILGGTFNPIHQGHLCMAQEVADQLKLKTVYFVPCYRPPHKTRENLIDARKRLEMVRLAIKGNALFKASDFEVKEKGKSYSIKTAKHFRKKLPKKTKLYFLIGSDSLKTLHTWKDIDELKRLVKFVCVNRPGVKETHKDIRVRHVTMPGLDISSSEIRSRRRRKRSIRYLTPWKVVKYIQKHRLYR